MTVVGNEGKERAARLIEAMADDGTSSALHARLREWFLSVPEGGVAEEALAEWAERNMRPDTAPPCHDDRERFSRLVAMLDVVECSHADASGSLRNHSRGCRMALRRIAALVAAALIAILFAAWAAIHVCDDKAEMLTVLHHAENEAAYKTFTLPDGSKVTLDPGSKLEYSGDFVSDRRVALDGRAFFDVAHDGVHPFVVLHEGFRIAVSGTKFHVNAHGDISEAEIILLSGSVSVETGNQRMELMPEQKLVLDKSRRAVVKLSRAGYGSLMRVSHNDLKIDNLDAHAAIVIVADYFGKRFVMDGDIGHGDYLNIVLPHDTTAETAVRCLDALTGTTKVQMEGDTIRASKE